MTAMLGSEQARDVAGDIETLRRYYAAWNESGLAGVMPYWTSDFEWHDAPEFPDGGVFHGPAAAEAHFHDLFATLGAMRVDLRELTPAAGEILVVLEVRLDGPISGLVIDGLIYEAVKLIDGKVARIRLFLEREQASRAIETG